MNKQEILAAIEKYTQERDRVVDETNKSLAVQRQEIAQREKAMESLRLHSQSRVDKLSGAIEAFEMMLSTFDGGSEQESQV